MGVKNKSCKLKIFSDILKAFLDKHDKTEHNKKVFFIARCQSFVLVLSSMYRMYLDKDNVPNFIDLVKERYGNSSGN